MGALLALGQMFVAGIVAMEGGHRGEVAPIWLSIALLAVALWLAYAAGGA